MQFMNDLILDAVADGKADIPPLRRSRDGITRGDVVKAFQNAFDIIGGTTRLALWANANPDKFFPLYAKLLPATTIALGEGAKLEIVHRIAPTALDQHDDATVPQRPVQDNVTEVNFREDNANS